MKYVPHGLISCQSVIIDPEINYLIQIIPVILAMNQRGSMVDNSKLIDFRGLFNEQRLFKPALGYGKTCKYIRLRQWDVLSNHVLTSTVV